MKNKNNAEAVQGFGIHRNPNKFFDSFNSNRGNQKFQCFNCEIWKRGDKLISVGQFDQPKMQTAVFRFCRACWRSYKTVSPELRQDFVENIRRKIKTAAGGEN